MADPYTAPMRGVDRMMRRLIRWLGSWSRTRRYRARKNDVQFLFPAIWFASGRDLGKFIDAVSLHTAMDPNWRGHEDEWRLTPADPGEWVAKRILASGGGS